MSAKIVTISLEEHGKSLLFNLAKGEIVAEWVCELDRLMEMPVLPSVRVILVGPPPEGIAVNDIAQFMRLQYPESAIFYLTPSRTTFVRKELIKSGFTDAFLIPHDQPDFEQSFLAELSKSGGQTKVYRSVKLIDVQPGQSMDFDTFLHLPANNKYIRYSASGDPIDPERAQKLAQHKVGSLKVQAQDIEKFYQFTATQLRKLGEDPAISETEKKDRMQGAIRELVSDLFHDVAGDANFKRGQNVVDDCQEIVKNYIMASVNGEDNKWYEKLLALSQNENSAYAHSAQVATFAALFSMSLGIGNPEHMAMAGILHDIGLSEVSADILAKKPHEWTDAEKSDYQRHPKVSVALIQSRKMVVPGAVLKIIAQHHERYDGKGYPESIKHPKFMPEAQLLAIADEFCYLTAPTALGAPLTAGQAMAKIHASIPEADKDHTWDPTIVKKLFDAFQPR